MSENQALTELSWIVVCRLYYHEFDGNWYLEMYNSGEGLMLEISEDAFALHIRTILANNALCMERMIADRTKKQKREGRQKQRAQEQGEPPPQPITVVPSKTSKRSKKAVEEEKPRQGNLLHGPWIIDLPPR